MGRSRWVLGVGGEKSAPAGLPEKHPHVSGGPHPGCWVCVMGRAWPCGIFYLSSGFDFINGLCG